MALRDSALLLLGHGSTLNGDSSRPTYQHAEEIRRRGIFAEVIVGFWKEEPNFRQTLRQTACREVYVVPNFISSGYFTEQVIPRELGLNGAVNRVGEQDVYYCEPVGLHPSMTEALLQRARQVVAASPEKIAEPARTACLFICGHGTSFNDNSTKIIHEQAEKIRSLGLFADCQGVLMEQAPFVADWRKLTPCADVVVVPFFISDGLHSYEDIPVLLGLTANVKEQSFTNPHREGERRLWYATAIGTEAFIADVILAQVEQLRARVLDKMPGTETVVHDKSSDLEAWFQSAPPPWHIGEVAIRPGYELLHRDDLGTPLAKLKTLASWEELREWVLLDAGEKFRPLRSAPNLRRGWIFRVANLAEVQLALDYLYPAAVANAALWKKGALPITPWKETAERQTGRFRIVREIDDAGALDLVATYCQPNCLKRRLWSPNEAPSLSVSAGEISLLCPEACNYLVGKAREKIKGGAEE
jgi:sirohydrochlorin cobaltochelatase